MPVTIDEPSVAARVALRRGKQRLGVAELRVHLDGLDRHESWRATEEAIAAEPSLAQGSTAYPTVGGTLALLTLASRPVAAMATLRSFAERLNSRGLHGSVVATDAPASRSGPRNLSVPVALAGFTIDPPVSAGPFNDARVPEPRWSAAPAGHAAWLDHVTTLVDAAAAGRIGDCAMVPTHPEHTREAIELELERRSECDLLTYATEVGTESGPEVVRDVVTMGSLGRVTWGTAPRDGDPSGGGVRAAYALEAALRRFAAHLDVGFVGHCAATTSAHLHLTGNSPWRTRRHLWASYVPAPHAVQLLTTDHLDRASDLSGWHVEGVAPQRWLVRHPDLEAWLTQAPDAGLLAQAASDFGAMVLTREEAARNPLHP
ncbi:hypothetical protein [Nocardioides daphniae]|uniref:Uncharacterized protein n=2 Tax=Nocardioides daphniae TaxID=402297 RepID=A0A4P7UBJ9_9ACTN|nr:hypothetical protein [Nocardioides daphniae]QCC76319.1 hypothetical protein E2C04_02240 [Nocardioides daphniae]